MAPTELIITQIQVWDFWTFTLFIIYIMLNRMPNVCFIVITMGILNLRSMQIIILQEQAQPQVISVVIDIVGNLDDRTCFYNNLSRYQFHATIRIQRIIAIFRNRNIVEIKCTQTFNILILLICIISLPFYSEE